MTFKINVPLVVENRLRALANNDNRQVPNTINTILIEYFKHNPDPQTVMDSDFNFRVHYDLSTGKVTKYK